MWCWWHHAVLPTEVLRNNLVALYAWIVEGVFHAGMLGLTRVRVTQVIETVLLIPSSSIVKKYSLVENDPKSYEKFWKKSRSRSLAKARDWCKMLWRMAGKYKLTELKGWCGASLAFKILLVVSLSSLHCPVRTNRWLASLRWKQELKVARAWGVYISVVLDGRTFLMVKLATCVTGRGGMM